MTPDHPWAPSGGKSNFRWEHKPSIAPKRRKVAYPAAGIKIKVGDNDRREAYELTMAINAAASLRQEIQEIAERSQSIKTMFWRFNTTSRVADVEFVAPDISLDEFYPLYKDILALEGKYAQISRITSCLTELPEAYYRSQGFEVQDIHP
ncbi:MAG: hypothetical protein JW941_05115 [Candidatus Coatesbacteria bacterium]|nr:hypothetical protein [Candidatus Coatesbacteria bacterium]